MKYFFQNLWLATAVFRGVEPFEFIRNMGFRYIVFRLWFTFQKRTGLLKLRFPRHTGDGKFITLKAWRNLPIRFFFDDQSKSPECFQSSLRLLKKRVQNLHDNKLFFFSSVWYPFTDWHTHPETGFRYDPKQHWSDIPDFSKRAGDIKYVWEMSRFCFLYDLIRYDFHYKEDQSFFVFTKIENWIEHNPVNCGPNWKCSQEIALRVLNWTFALQYYKHSSHLKAERFDKIVNSIHRQMQHVEENINFSKIVVRNNHVLTETLGLYLVGLLFPFFPESARWKEKGRKWFEKEIAYQIEEDGTFLQSSMNYHRIVVQLLTWAIRLAGMNEEKWNDLIYDRARKSLHFLQACQDDQTGWLPNYGNNDGALFFPLTESHFRDYRPQLAALASLLAVDLRYKQGIWQEETFWIGARDIAEVVANKNLSTLFTFPKGGYYVFRDEGTVTFLRCGKYKHRPFQADNLHLDIWDEGENIMHDAGSYGYNRDQKWARYFMGTASHNTVMLGDNDQMRKGPGFVWYDWIKKSRGAWRQAEEGIIFDGDFEGFRHLSAGIKHRRTVLKTKGALYWEICDLIENGPYEVAMRQLWHPSDTFFEKYTIQAFDESGCELVPELNLGWYSDFYGLKQESQQIIYSSPGRFIRTIIKNDLSENFL